MKNVYGYIRVSTTEQVTGASLPEQKSAIEEYAKKNSLTVIHFYEESKTAAKKGRPLFLEMIKNLKKGKAKGVIMHKIDRSARNLHDWALVGDLIDSGIDVFFAHESLNMNERGGRLSADIQAVMASDYVRNLRQEISKGLYGRLKQGFYPWSAPLGYINNGSGEHKTIDPVNGKLIKELFELYMSGKYNIESLSKEMEIRGLRNRKGNKVCKNGIVRILKNPFYIGIIKVKGQFFNGKHEPILETKLFERIQKILRERNKGKSLKHSYLFRKLVKCHNCNYTMSGEIQKGHIYYRCKTRKCRTKCVREDILENYVIKLLKTLKLYNTEVKQLTKIIEDEKGNALKVQSQILKEYNLKISQINEKEQRLLDAYLEKVITKEEYTKQKEFMLIKIKELQEKKEKINTDKKEIFKQISSFVELCKTPVKYYKLANQDEKREMLEIISSNLRIDGRRALFTMVSPYSDLSFRSISSSCGVNQETSRTMNRIIVYSDKNTSPIMPKPMNAKQIKEFYHFLYGCSESLSKIVLTQEHFNTVDS